MRIESTKGENEYKCWLTPEDYEALCEAAQNRSDKHYITILLGGKCGLRAAEIAALTPKDKHRTDSGGWRVRVREAAGKDTTGTGGKTRDAYLTDDVERELLAYSAENDIDERDTYLGVTATRVRQIVTEAAEETGRKEGMRMEDWSKVSSHDPRRYYAQTLLVRQKINPRVVMSVGGWESMQALKPYLAAPVPEVVDEEMRSVDF